MCPEPCRTADMVEASAPAKVILFGEHAVVYGHPAIAAPVSALRTHVRVQSAQAGELSLFSGDPPRRTSLDAAPALLDAVTRTIQLTADACGRSAPVLEVFVQSSIPIASGLGSGAALSAALARAVSQFLGVHLELPLLNQIVYEIEKIHHGTPSGIDNTVIVYEQALFFIRDHPIQSIHLARPFTLMIADTGISAPTRIAVGDVRQLVENQPDLILPVLRAIGDVVMQARRALEDGDLEILGNLMSRNHELLRALTVSSPELDRLVDAALSAGAIGAKLSGGGRGGNMIALVSEESASQVEQALLRAGAVRVFRTTVPGDAF